MHSHQDEGYLKLLIRFTERAIDDYPYMQEQLDRLKAEYRLLVEVKHMKKKKGK